MSEKNKLALSRGRVFQFDSTVIFYGKCKDLAEDEANKTLKQLSLKEPVITAVIELCDDSSAYVVTHKVSPKMIYSNLKCKEIVKNYNEKPLMFFERLFEFSFSNDGYLVIAGHTAVCDAKSLLRLGKYFACIYEKKDLSIEENRFFTFAEPKSLPVDVISPLTNKLSSELDNKWQRYKKIYSEEDFKNACEKYFFEKKPVREVLQHLSAGKILSCRIFCEKHGVDLSSLVYFSLYKSILKHCDVKKTSSRMRIYADRRFFHGKGDIYSIGAYNGSVNIGLNNRELRKSDIDKLKSFHLDAYRALTSPFRVFYEDILHMKVDSSLCDSAFMYLAGLEKNKVSRNFAETHSCLVEELCDCFYCNINQEYWRELDFYCDVYVEEPFKARTSKYLSFIESENGGLLVFKYRKSEISDKVAREIVDDMILAIESLIMS